MTKQEFSLNHKVFTEMEHLLATMRFSAAESAYCEGETVTILVNPCGTEDPQIFQARITCYPFGHRQLDWSKYALVATAEKTGEAIHAFAFLDARGQSIFSALPQSQYTLRLCSRIASAALSPGPAGAMLQENYADQSRGAYAAQSQKPAGEISAMREKPLISPLFDERIRCTLIQKEAYVELALETSEQELANAKVACLLLDMESRQELESREVCLSPPKRKGAPWEGVWPIRRPRPWELLMWKV